MTLPAAAPELVLRLPPSTENPRNSEGSFVALRDERILFVYTHFTGSSRDDAAAHLASRISADGGRTWSATDEVVARHPAGDNVMSVSLLRLADGRIALFYLSKDGPRQWPVMMRLSADEGQTWSDARSCSPEPGAYVLNNDRAVRLSSGRLVLPVAFRPPEPGPLAESEAWIACLLSDDGGDSWRFSRDRRRVAGVWTQEPGVIELRDGRLLLWCRTQAGCQYVSYSADGGEGWEELRPSAIVSSLSPASMKRLPATGDLLLVWNPVDDPWTDWDRLRRSPLCTAISRDEGATWEGVRTLASDPAHWYCYTAVEVAGDAVLLAHSDGTGRTHQRLAPQVIHRVPLEWLYGALPGGTLPHA